MLCLKLVEGCCEFHWASHHQGLCTSHREGLVDMPAMGHITWGGREKRHTQLMVMKTTQLKGRKKGLPKNQPITTPWSGWRGCCIAAGAGPFWTHPLCWYHSDVWGRPHMMTYQFWLHSTLRPYDPPINKVHTFKKFSTLGNLQQMYNWIL